MKRYRSFFRTLTQRFGALYVFLIAILLGMSVVITLHLRTIRLDSKRLIEEAREQTSVAGLLAEIDALGTLLRSSDVDPVEVARVRELLSATWDGLAELEGGEDDPSLDEHQDAENRIAERLEADLRRADQMLAGAPAASEVGEARRLLDSVRHFARVLLAEARDEAREANDDLQARTRLTRAILIGTWAAAALLLVLSLVLVHRGIVAPLRVLRAGAERFGQGDRSHRIEVSNTDEIGDMARTFNDMADKLAQAQDDLEERVRTRTREFLRAARLADLGLLASGIAHEINTPLASIASSAEGLQRRCRNGDTDLDLVAEYSRTISEEAFRAREITTRMLALVRQEPSDVSRVSLALVVAQAVSALRHRAEKRSIRLVSPEVGDDVIVEANAGELVQILVNLLANAIDASSPGGRVEFDVSVRENELQLVVEDEGSGIRDEDLERVFEPFYTTKRAGEGTGLGLALVATMVESSGGRLSVESELGEGSVFRVSLPVERSADR